jgi:hypothetical protein
MTCAPSRPSWLSASGGRGGVGYSVPERLTKTVDAIFAILAKLIGTTARVGAYVMVATAVLVALVESHVQPFARLAEPPLYLYQGIVTAGVLGFAILVVEIVVASWQRFRQWRAGRIIFNHNLPGMWNYAENRHEFQLRTEFLATNDSDRDVVPTGARVCVRKFVGKREWQTCFQVYLDGELWTPARPAFSVPLPLRAHSVTAIRLNDIHRAMPSRAPLFLFELRDQWGRPHRIRLRLEPRPPRVTAAPASAA